ncbi:hypothetical protein FBU30_007983 [Linnemannia zychae]|nr:hypothetical protein FBU30_007983 [Linnemannia zychae]
MTSSHPNEQTSGSKVANTNETQTRQPLMFATLYDPEVAKASAQAAAAARANSGEQNSQPQASHKSQHQTRNSANRQQESGQSSI